MQISINRNGYLWTVRLDGLAEDGTLANGAKAYTGGVAFQRDGALLGVGQWDGEGFQDAPELLPDLDATQDVLSALEREVRAALAKLGGAA